MQFDLRNALSFDDKPSTGDNTRTQNRPFSDETDLRKGSGESFHSVGSYAFTLLRLSLGESSLRNSPFSDETDLRKGSGESFHSVGSYAFTAVRASLRNSPIVGYIHICQIGEWERSFTMIIDAIKRSGLYDAAKEIRCGILHDSENHHYVIDKHRILEDPKFRVIYVGTPEEYERPTLLHMRNAAATETDPINTKYFYLHTKGIRWFGTQSELFVVDWIKLLIYWNIEKWINAEDSLNKYDTYGCNYYSGEKYPPHYSGNFFWTTSHHLKTLSPHIGKMYNDPEFWLFSSGACGGRPNSFNAFSSGYECFGHYCKPFPESKYRDI